MTEPRPRLPMSEKEFTISALAKVLWVLAGLISTVLANLFALVLTTVVLAAPPGDAPELFGLPSTAVEVVEARSQHAKHFRNPDGSFTALLVQDIHYEAVPGSWALSNLDFAPDGVDDVMRRHQRHEVRITANGIDITDRATGKGVRWFTPKRPVAAGNRAEYNQHGLVWEYELTNSGLKSSATVAGPQGSKTYTFTYAMLGGAADFTIDASGNAVGDGFIVPRATVEGDDGAFYLAGPWSLVAGPRIAFTFDDSILPKAAYPYVIDPATTLQPGSAGLDSWIRSVLASSNFGTNADLRSGDGSGAQSMADRPVIQFDVSSIPSNASVTSATLSLWEYAADWQNSPPASCAFNLHRLLRDWVEAEVTWDDYSSGNAWTTAGAGSDGNDRVAAASATVTLDATAAADFIDWTGSTLDANVEDFIDGTLSNYGWLLEAPSCELLGNSPQAQQDWRSSDYDTASQRPKLVVVYVVPSAAITGTIGDGASEQDIRDADNPTPDGDIIITLTNDTWVAAGGTFDAQRQAIINGLDAADAQTNGWNAQVRDQLTVGSVVRTSGTVVTITPTAAAVANYRIADSETITVTVPNAALVTSGSDRTATPTIAVTAGVESMAVTGSLGGSGGTPAELVAGGETVILTLTNTKWVVSGSFNAQRQNIIDNLDSNLSDQNGWDTRRADFAVGDVVRTSDSVVTITLSASSAYAIPSTEIITATAPASAMVFGIVLTGTPTFNIVPSFQASGTRVSTAIDLSSVTDVAYCSLAWEATTPTNTTFTVDTSVNGGTSYTSGHTNGNCPAGVTVGASLAATTDFRIRLNLSTTDSTVTPTVQTVALIIEDDSGQDLYYQLNTTPGVTLSDRSGGGHTGTMSYPVAATGVTVTVGGLETTREGLTFAEALRVPDAASPVTGSAVDSNLFSQNETGFTGLPGNTLVQAMASAGDGLPVRFIWAIFLGLGAIALGIMAMHFTQSVFFAALGMGAGLAFAFLIGNGLVGGWTIFLFAALAAALILLRPKVPL